MDQQDKNKEPEKTESLVDLEVTSEQADDTTAGSRPMAWVYVAQFD